MLWAHKSGHLTGNACVSETNAGVPDAVSRLRVRVVVCAGVLVFMSMTASGAGAATTFSARGSVEQVYVTGLAPNAQMSLLNGAGTTIATRQANSLGAFLFRDVPPGSGYRVRPSGEGRHPLR